MISKTLYVGSQSEFKTIQSALNSLDPGEKLKYIINIGDGIYYEKIKIMIPGISLVGNNPDKCVITYNDNALKRLPNGTKMGTFNSFTLYIGSENFYMENITIQNSSGPGYKAGQAIALYADSDKIHLKNCKILGFQDTLFTGPLPIDPVPKGINAQHCFNYTKDKNDKVFRQLYEECYIEGNIDFIFGSARVLFRDCEIYSILNNNVKHGYITAPSHKKGEEFGYLFYCCNITGADNLSGVYLGRPWRPGGKASFIKCILGDHINPKGWDSWNCYEDTAIFKEYCNSGPGSNMENRVHFQKQMTDMHQLQLDKYVSSWINLSFK